MYVRRILQATWKFTGLGTSKLQVVAPLIDSHAIREAHAEFDRDSSFTQRLQDMPFLRLGVYSELRF